jgi:hypothetical protein
VSAAVIAKDYRRSAMADGDVVAPVAGRPTMTGVGFMAIDLRSDKRLDVF